MIVGIPADQYVDHMDSLAPFLRGFAQRSLGRWTLESLEMDIINRDRQIWNIHDFQAVGMTSVGPEAVNIDAAAGVRRREWQEEFDETVKKWARSLGKKRIIATVRPGWARFGKARGYREAHREMVLEI